MAVRKRSVPSRWDERRQRQEQRSAAYWAGERAQATDPVDLAAVVWDQLRNALRALDRKSANRVERASTPGEKETAVRRYEEAVALTGRVCADVIACLDRKIAEVRDQS